MQAFLFGFHFSIFFFFLKVFRRWWNSEKMVDIASWGCICRIKKCAFEFLSIVDLMDYEDRWDLMGRDIHLKSTFLYCDFYRVISNAPKEEKRPLIDLANKLFHSIEEVCMYAWWGLKQEMVGHPVLTPFKIWSLKSSFLTCRDGSLWIMQAINK